MKEDRRHVHQHGGMCVICGAPMPEKKGPLFRTVTQETDEDDLSAYSEALGRSIEEVVDAMDKGLGG